MIDTMPRDATILQRVTLADGASVTVRPAETGDAPRLERMYFRLSAQSIYYRLFVGAPYAAHWATRFAAISANTANDSVALVAVAGAEVIGTARFDRDDLDTSAEVGIVVEDAWQGRGLGRYLLRRLAQEALLRGITMLTARTLGENRRALRLFKGTFVGTQITFAQGEYTMVAPILPIGLAAITQAITFPWRHLRQRKN